MATMIGTILMIFAGWFRNKIAAFVIIAAVIALQAFVVIPGLKQQHSLFEGLSGGVPGPRPESHGTLLVIAVVEAVVLGLIFYFIGSGLRALRDRRRRS
jgi:hypothetical protein